MYNITLTHDRAMGNAYAVYTPSLGKSIVLCDGRCYAAYKSFTGKTYSIYWYAAYKQYTSGSDATWRHTHLYYRGGMTMYCTFNGKICLMMWDIIAEKYVYIPETV